MTAEIGSFCLRLPPLPTIKEILRLYQLRAVKKLSQNFLLQEKVINKIPNAAGSIRDCYVCEVGPGPGGISRAILEKGAKRLIVVEKDRRFKPCLDLLADASNGRMSVIFDDILATKMEDIFPPSAARAWDDRAPPIHIIGNLPFNISTPLIVRWLRAMSERSGPFSFGRVPLTLTFQKEIAERMVADVNHHQRCRLSVMCQYLTYVEHKCNIPGSMCVPEPDVDIGVVKFRPLTQPLIKQPFTLVEKMMRHVFHHRQKHCRRGIKTLFPEHMQEELTNELFEKTGVDFKKRSFRLTMEELRLMCDVYAEMCARIPNLIKYEYRIKSSVDEWKDFDV